MRQQSSINTGLERLEVQRLALMQQLAQVGVRHFGLFDARGIACATTPVCRLAPVLDTDHGSALHWGNAAWV